VGNACRCSSYPSPRSGKGWVARPVRRGGRGGKGKEKAHQPAALGQRIELSSCDCLIRGRGGGEEERGAALLLKKNAPLILTPFKARGTFAFRSALALSKKKKKKRLRSSWKRGKKGRGRPHLLILANEIAKRRCFSVMEKRRENNNNGG